MNNNKNLREMTHGSLFSGIGGFELGAQMNNIPTLWNCEIEDFQRTILKKVFPDTKQYEDIKELSKPEYVDIISGGFPCQDISIAGKGEGITGSRSGLWNEMFRIIRKVRPRYVLIENSPMLLIRGFERVLCDLSEIGYNAEWDCFRACDFGYPHRRKRLYVVAYPSCNRRKGRILQSPGTYELSQKWTPTEAYLSVSTGRLNGFRDIRAIQRDDVFPYFGREIKAFGNAVMPVVGEHLFRCILDDYMINS